VKRLLEFLVMVMLVVVGATGLYLERCLRRPKPVPAQVDMIVLSESLLPYAEGWKREISRKYPDAVGILAHGVIDMPDRWNLLPDHMEGGLRVKDCPRLVEDVVRETKARQPGRIIVLVVCNPFHFRPDWPGVVYSTQDVWTTPDRELIGRQNGEGSILEFREP
jgi:hypothetical protein